ncbi:unnamed protein product [Miscanthus lutarioriparius]|uniref:Pentatricopeptide repeat-containing protein n=1 Tax=Miscanthus lutarioriparius TaxID=422564 RepID=A0A811SGN8_9POAL|nr:unnamed protein product [Miscanthus lutarioriparius]
MVERYFDAGRDGQGFRLFVRMLRSGIQPNEFTYRGVLRAYAEFTCEKLGKQGAWSNDKKSRAGDSCFAESALVHIYSKYGDMGTAVGVFRGMPKPDLVSWTASSWIEAGTRVHVFLVGDKLHPQAEEIYALLKKAVSEDEGRRMSMHMLNCFFCQMQKKGEDSQPDRISVTQTYMDVRLSNVTSICLLK